MKSVGQSGWSHGSSNHRVREMGKETLACNALSPIPTQRLSSPLADVSPVSLPIHILSRPLTRHSQAQRARTCRQAKFGLRGLGRSGHLGSIMGSARC